MDLRESSPQYASLDRSVQLALLAARGIEVSDAATGVNIGSSRGATGLWEAAFSRFRESGTVPTDTSPLTTLGNISSWVAQDLQLEGACLSHSITCATGSHAILNAIAWLASSMSPCFLVGGSEAPLTEFTIAQMRAMRIYARNQEDFPCKAMDPNKRDNSMILGEAAAMFLLTKAEDNPLAKIIGYGTAIEALKSPTSVSAKGNCLRDSMTRALGPYDPTTVDAIVTHAPGTIKGDRAELAAVQSVFGEQHPQLCNNKWILGHSLGASSSLNLAMALEMLKKGSIFKLPYLENALVNPRGDQRIPKRIMVNATGFGGNAVSLLIEKA